MGIKYQFDQGERIMTVIENEQCRLEKILYEMNYFYHTTGRDPHYLVMSRDTYKFINVNIRDYFSCCRTDKNEIKIYDTDVAFCDSLKFGEVDVV